LQNFGGSKQDKDKGMHWFSWDLLTQLKHLGGLGFLGCACFSHGDVGKIGLEAA
jgi:hypothetical protein